tara:strand:- start:3397 stop:4431 length:1035 start_codon:yes stop_codon:yes gene_type:complete
MNTNKFKDKRMNIMVNKIGLSEKKATWCLEKDKKYSIWIANQLKTYKFLFSDRERLIQFSIDIDNILNWKREVQNLNLNDYDFETALSKSITYQQSLFVSSEKSLKNKKVILDCGEYKWVKLSTQEDCIEEGNFMNHCIGGNSHAPRIESGISMAFSLRDKFNKPHLTLEANLNNKIIIEFKGSSNSLPKAEYLDYFVQLNQKYNFTKIQDYTIESFKDNLEAIKEINKINSEFFTTEFKLEVGIGTFEGVEFHLNKIIINTKNKIEIPNNFKLTNSLDIISTNSVTIGNNVLIGGNLIVKCNVLNLGNNIGIGGNFYLDKSLGKNKQIENVDCFGEFSFKDID